MLLCLLPEALLFQLSHLGVRYILINICIWDEVDDQDPFYPCGDPVGPASSTEKAIVFPLQCGVAFVTNHTYV